MTCADDTGTDPCDVVDKPAVVPGEKTVIFWDGWTHGFTEPSGSYVFRYTIHGTVDGVPVDLTASSRPIEMLPPMVPEVKGFKPSRGSAGTTVEIKGKDFTGATAVTFNGTDAGSFTVDSDRQITAVVAVGTTTGPVRVTSPAGTGTSRRDFRVS